MASPPGPTSPSRLSTGELLLSSVGLVYMAAGIVFAIVYLFGGVTSSLFPTGWILPAVLTVTGALMAIRRRSDIVLTLWGGLTLAVFLIDMEVYMVALDLGLSDPAAFDATIIVSALGLVGLVLRPRFRR